MMMPIVGQVPAAEISALRKDPYKLFFPLGVLLSWVGVGQWLWFSLGATTQFRVIFHAMVQVQGFLACFVAGFLFTFIPRRTATAPAAGWQLGLAALCPVLLAIFAWQERWAISQLFWLVQLAVLFQFVVSRARRSRGTAPAAASLIWIPVALAFGFVGAGLTPFSPMHALGRALVLEGMVAALVMGIGSMLVPVITRAQPPRPEQRWPQWLGVALFVASFVIETQTALPKWLAYAMRLGVVLFVLVRGAQLWKKPTQPGLNRWVVLGAAWCLPLGYALLTLWPAQRSAGLHVIFVGGFGLLALAIGQHVIVAHAGRGDLLTAWPRATWGLAGLTAAALAARAAMQLDPSRYLQWMTVAALAFVGAGACWLWGMGPLVLGALISVRPSRAPTC